ncbi:DUF2892 domain-containing protein [Caulobacter sp. HMWF009]|nr:DUF2892 domain-containing protein [Caulobacter sp. HMWF009]PTT11814.1 DUF2892 domain-containing protein [Caulobacter sp. HMWF025]
MKFMQNVPTWERVLRLVLGLSLVAGSLTGLKPGLLAYGLELTGAILALTSFIGFCPMCAMAGRKPLAKAR